MKRLLVPFVLLAISTFAAQAQRKMEKLDRGVVAVRTGLNSVFISWRVLGLDATSTTFNLYRSTNGASVTKLNGSPLSVSNFSDTQATIAASHRYYVRPVVGGVEQGASLAFQLAANGATEPAVRIPIRARPGYDSQFVWVGDFDGDGEYDFLVDRKPSVTESQKLEAYTRTGEFLWVVDLGVNSLDVDNIEPGAATIDVGHWDGVTVYDLDGDGRAEVALRSADGVVFGDGKTVSGLGTNRQAISVIDGLTGKERARSLLPQDFLADGPMGAHLGVAYLNGSTPSLVAKMKNRVGSGAFNLMIVTWDLGNNGALTQKWKWVRGTADADDFHQIRIFDVDRNGSDEICDGGYVLNADGSYRYKVGGATVGVVHGDRFHIADLNPARAGLEGFAIQQNHPGGLQYLIYDASNGSVIRTHFGAVADVARGVVGDIDPATPGWEYWAFDGCRRIDTGAVVKPTAPYPNFRIWWDGDVLSETLNDGKIEKWNPSSASVTRLFTVGSSANGVGGSTGERGAPYFYGDILGDWREEIVSFNSDRTQLIVCTTPMPTSVRLYTLAHNPAYRAAMTVKGYMQSHQPDYYLGQGMTTPGAPNIAFVPLVLQAEVSAQFGGGVVIESNQSGYSGAGFANFPSSGGYLQWTRVNGAAGGGRILTFRYANGGSARAGRLVVNGSAQTVNFPSTNGWNKWSTLSVTVSLNPAATNTVRLESIGQDLANVDSLSIP